MPLVPWPSPFPLPFPPWSIITILSILPSGSATAWKTGALASMIEGSFSKSSADARHR
jgi:hypothetical protein